MISFIPEALSPKHGHRKLSDIKHLVVHRTLATESINDLIREFKDTTKFAAGWYTGGKFPYHFVIPTFGDLVQMLPLTRVGPAAKAKLNLSGIHIALMGDFRKKPPSDGQMIHLNHAVMGFHNAFEHGLSIGGHTEFAGASDDPNKQCPGKYLDMDAVREYADAHMGSICLTDTKTMLESAGVVV